MILSTAQAYDLLARHGVFAREACDRCGAILGAVRYTRRGNVRFGVIVVVPEQLAPATV
jgi:hypothetical protein